MKNYLASALFIMISGSVYGQNYTPVINYNYNGTPTHGVKIKTNLPFQNGHHMPTLIIEGYNYGQSKPIGLILNWYIYSNNFYNPGVSSFGAHTPEITLANEGGKVVIFIDHRGYYNRFSVRAFAKGMQESSTHFQNWSVVDEAIGGVNHKVIPYKNAFAGNVGIGTTAPVANLHVSGATSGDGVFRLEADTDNNNEGDNARIEILQDGGASATYIGYNQDWGGTWQPDNLFRIGVRYNNVDITDAFVIKPQDGNVGIGTTNPDQKLTVAGTVKSKEIIVEENAGADFVFEEDYALPTLEQIEKFIKANKHLEGIASAEEMKANGVKVGELQIQLLQKIEELTLYVIDLKKENTTLKRQESVNNVQQEVIDKLMKMNEDLLNRITKLENKKGNK